MLLDGQHLVDLARAVLDSAHVRADLSDSNGLPLRVGLSAANTHDGLALKPMLSPFHMGHESHATDSKPGRSHADKAYDTPHLRRWLWGIECTMSWLTGYRRLNHRYERRSST
ncbi:hypothetical protein SUDANB66_06469 (plasmid) [Streptomyces sp. SudanB66_2053]